MSFVLAMVTIVTAQGPKTNKKAFLIHFLSRMRPGKMS